MQLKLKLNQFLQIEIAAISYILDGKSHNFVLNSSICQKIVETGRNRKIARIIETFSNKISSVISKFYIRNNKEGVVRKPFF